MSKISKSLEAVQSGVENEVVIYARIGNYEGLKQATSVTKQTQAQVIFNGARLRVRKNEQEGKLAQYEMTNKFPISRDGTQQMEEATAELNADAFEVFLKACDQKMVKTRYVFPIEKTTIKTKDLKAEVELEGLVFEVDVFIKPDGSASTWCKIDVEVQSLLPQLAEKGLKLSDIDLNIKVSSLPFQPQAAFVDNGDKDGPMRELVTVIYDKEFITKLR